jgi:long-chain acyl-CoA synthetase
MAVVRSGDRSVSTADMALKVARAATALASLGVGPGDTVALCLRNDFAFLEASLAAGQLGAYPVPVNWHYVEDEVSYLLENCGARVVLIHADLLGPVRNAIPRGASVLVVPTPPEIVEAYSLSPDQCAPPSDLPVWDSWVDGYQPAVSGAREAPGTIIYTSGTTGRPKGVRRHPPTADQAAVANRTLMTVMGFAGYENAPDSIVSLVAGPMYHSAPNAFGILAARLGANLILQPRFDAEELLDLIQRHRVTHLQMVPIMFNRLLKLPPNVRERYDVSSLKHVIHTAAPCAPPVKRAMIEWWGPVINEMYGSTETYAVSFCTSEQWLAHPGTVGRALPDATIRVLDPNGAELPPGEVGEVVGRFLGMADFTYHGDDQKRRDAEKRGLIAPGDVGYLDEDGFLYICDRATDMVISGGTNIYPAEIEAELQKLAGVADCCVFGIPDEEFGESVCAAVQLQPGVAVTEADVKDYMRGQVAGYKVPRRVVFYPDLPREDSGKIFKRKLREPFWSGMDRRI